jgi:hypothetical protein
MTASLAEPPAEQAFAWPVAALYGPTFAPFLNAKPTSAIWADGSQVRVYPGQTIT